jgi:ATP-dependent Clp protease ATP-binding subunit ClpA/ATP-dependent Clp protease ATP-binding subunit ClpC
VKRYLEERIGALLTEHIAAGTRAAMQLIRVYHDGRRLALHAEPLVEAEPAGERFFLEPLLDRPVEELREQLSAKLALLDRWREAGLFTELSEQIGYHLGEHNLGHAEHADPVVHLDAIRHELEAFREQIEHLVHGRQLDAAEAIELERFSYETTTDPNRIKELRTRVLDRRFFHGAMPRRLRDEILTCLAEMHFLERAIPNVHERSQHAVFIELLKIGRAAPLAAPGGLLAELVEAYASGRGEVEACASLSRDGAAIKTGGLSRILEPGVEHAVLKVIGLSVLDFFEPETGCHIWQSLTHGPELVRVRVLPVRGGKTPSDLIEEHRAARLRFERALEQGSVLPENPGRLLPAVRRYRFDPPPPGARGGTAELDLEDYSLGYSTSARVRRLAEILPRVWLIQMSRERTQRQPAPSPAN